MNSFQIIGRLTQDITVKPTKSDTVWTSFSIAYNHSKDETSFFDCKAFNKTAEILENYTKKGAQVAICGYLKQDKWEDDNGNNRSKTMLYVTMVTLIGSKGDSSNSAPGQKKNKSKDDDELPF